MRVAAIAAAATAAVIAVCLLCPLPALRAQPVAASCESQFGAACLPPALAGQCAADPRHKPGEMWFSACRGDSEECYVNGTTYCTAPDPAKAAETRRKAAAAAAAARLEAAAAAVKAREKQALVDAETARLGARRSEEARKIVETRLEAEAARQRARSLTQRGQCVVPESTTPISWWARPVVEINKDYAELQQNPGCAGGTVGPLICKEAATLFIAINNCDATVTCPAKTQECGPRAVAR